MRNKKCLLELNCEPQFKNVAISFNYGILPLVTTLRYTKKKISVLNKLTKQVILTIHCFILLETAFVSQEEDFSESLIVTNIWIV